jgi:D-lyxose ketol-isomerase
MKHSEINAIIRSADAFVRAQGYYLPPFAYWNVQDWQKKGIEVSEIVENSLGWDITDFGMGDFTRFGLFLFTLPNGSPKNLVSGRGKLYPEKVNDDNHDNRFFQPIGRFPTIEEDEEPLYLLVSDYAKYYQAKGV